MSQLPYRLQSTFCALGTGLGSNSLTLLAGDGPTASSYTLTTPSGASDDLTISARNGATGVTTPAIIVDKAGNVSVPSLTGVGTIDGDLAVTGMVAAENMETSNGGPGYRVVGAGPSYVSAFAHIQGLTPATLIQSDDPIRFTRMGAEFGNTTLVQSAQGANTDVLQVSGTISPLKFTLPTEADALGAATAGKAAILEGSDDVVVYTTAVTANSIILVTRMGDPVMGPGNGSAQQSILVPSANIVPGVSFQAFLVDAETGINTAADRVNAEFSWIIIN
jgi:hypothetical protein